MQFLKCVYLSEKFPEIFMCKLQIFQKIRSNCKKWDFTHNHLNLKQTLHHLINKTYLVK